MENLPPQYNYLSKVKSDIYNINSTLQSSERLQESVKRLNKDINQLKQDLIFHIEQIVNHFSIEIILDLKINKLQKKINYFIEQIRIYGKYVNYIPIKRTGPTFIYMKDKYTKRQKTGKEIRKELLYDSSYYKLNIERIESKGLFTKRDLDFYTHFIIHFDNYFDFPKYTYQMLPKKNIIKTLLLCNERMELHQLPPEIWKNIIFSFIKLYEFCYIDCD